MKELRNELAEANFLYHQHRFDDAIKEATYYIRSDDMELRAQAYNIIGIAFIGKEEYEHCLTAFQAAAHAWKHPILECNVAVGLLWVGKIEEGLKAHKESMIKLDSTDITGAGISRRAAIYPLIKHQAFEHALPLLNDFWEQYQFLHITDDHFLISRGLPTFEHFFELATPVLNALADKFNGYEWLQILKAAVDKKGKKKIDEATTQLIPALRAPSNNTHFAISLPASLIDQPLYGWIEDEAQLPDGPRLFGMRVRCGILQADTDIYVKDADFINEKVHLKAFFDRGGFTIRDIMPGQIAYALFDDEDIPKISCNLYFEGHA